MIQLGYFIKFRTDLLPKALVARNFEELWRHVSKMVQERGEPFEWLIKDRTFNDEMADLIIMMPDHQVDEILETVKKLREIRKK